MATSAVALFFHVLLWQAPLPISYVRNWRFFAVPHRNRERQIWSHERTYALGPPEERGNARPAPSIRGCRAAANVVMVRYSIV